MNELLTELNAEGVDTGIKGMETLDVASSAQEKLDLQFADGLKMVAKFVDGGTKSTNAVKDTTITSEVGEKASRASENATNQLFQLLESASSLEDWEKSKFEATMHEAVRISASGLPSDPNLKKPVAGSLDASHPFSYFREFVDEGSSEESCAADDDEGSNDNLLPDDKGIGEQMQLLNNIIIQAFTSSTQLYRTLLLRAAAQTLLENWDTLTTSTSGDIDRAAVSKTVVPPQRSTVKAKNIQKLFDAYAHGSSKEWVQSWWNLIDADEDGLIDEEEMNACINMAMKPIHMALSDMVHMSLEVCPVRTVGSDEANAWFLGGESTPNCNTAESNPESAVTNVDKKLSWRNRRTELKARKSISKTFQATLDRHFRDQVETPHRLRCIYAWAEKSHQDNKLDSILVDSSEEFGGGTASSIMGRQRYVELVPKISYPEFRVEQKRHFYHLDKIGEEIAVSFKEDLWVVQGKGRQNKELRQQIFMFLGSVSLVDFGIYML